MTNTFSNIVWSIMKNNLGKRRAQYSASDIRKIMSYDMLEEAHQSFREILTGVDSKAVKGDHLCYHVFKEMKKVMDGKIV
jgi:hypothetical protein